MSILPKQTNIQHILKLLFTIRQTNIFIRALQALFFGNDKIVINVQ
jgi:hypothetical protein